VVARLAGRCVLVVEDEALIALMTQSMLRDLGCEIVGVAHTLTDAMAMIQANLHCLDAVALDINLGGEHAAPLAGLLDANGIPFIVTTGYDDALLLEAFDGRPVLTKPFLAEHLAQALVPLLRADKGRSAG
jgi:CheY-like chemotaxis protein